MRIQPLVANMGVYTVKVKFNPDNSRTDLALYTALTLTVGCRISSIAGMSSSSLTLTYKVFKDATVVLDFANASVSPNTQTPVCGFTLTKSYSFANGPSYSAASTNGFESSVFTGANTGLLSIIATNTDKIKTYSITVTQTIIDAFSKLYN